MKAEATRPPAATIKASAQSVGRRTGVARRGLGPMEASGSGPPGESACGRGAGRADLFTCHRTTAKPSARRVLQPRSADRFHIRSGSALSGALRGPRVCAAASPASGRRAPTPDTLPRSSSRPRPLGRTVHFDPGWVTDLGWQTGRPQGGREGGVLPRAPPSHAQRRTSPPCAPSRAPSPSGERDKVRAPPPPLKGAAAPRPPHPARDGSALSPQTPVESPQRLSFPRPVPCFSPGASPFDREGLDGRGRGWNLSCGFCCRSYCRGKGRCRRGRLGPESLANGAPRAPGCKVRLAAAGLGVPARRLAVSGRSSSHAAPSLSSWRCCLFFLSCPPAPIHPEPSWEWSLSKARQ